MSSDSHTVPNPPPRRERLFSLDLLRGLDMFLLTVVGPFFAALHETSPLPDRLMAQFHHRWGGFTLWDIIMPLFLFMCGAAIPFALPRRRENGRAGLRYWRHIAARVGLLWLLGMVAQGRLLSFDTLLINPFNNTLQAIASGYLVAAAVLCIPSRKLRTAVPFLLAAAYTALLHFGGDYTLEGNAATRIEYWILPRITPAGSQALALADPGYSWWPTIPMFAVMTLCGMSATDILRSDAPPKRRFLRLLALGAALLAGGWALSPWIPPVKHIYTLTFTAQAMGWCCLALAVLYALTDILRLRRGAGLFLLFGQTSLLAYMCDEFSPVFRAFGKMFAPGAEHLFGPSAAPLAIWLASSVLLVAVLHTWRKASARKSLPVAVLAALLLACPALAQDPAAAPAIPLQGMTPLATPLGACLLIARERNPLVEAARHRCQAAGLDTESLRRSFRDPVARASVGYYESPVDVPFGGFAPDIAADSASAQAGLEAPLAAGVYGGAGARFGRTVSAGEDDGDGFQSAGAHLRIPLLKDRGFAQNRLEEERLDREALAARAAYEVALLDAWTSVADTYAQVLFRLADAAEVSNALVRAEQLVQDATERASLEDIAEYQVYPARYESATRAEELAGARTQIDIGMESLRLAVGAPLPAALDFATPEDAFAELSQWSESLASLDTAPLLARPVEDCPEVRAAQEVCNAALAQVEFETDSARDNLDIRLGAGWQSDRDIHTDRETGFGASLVFSRPLGGSGRDAAVAAATARAEAAYQDFVQTRLRAEVRRTQAAAALESARGRRRLARETVEAARLVLEAENERFAIGDNSSRNVLDAQKDLSTARRRELAVSLEVITATAELFRACGVPLDAQKLP